MLNKKNLIFILNLKNLIFINLDKINLNEKFEFFKQKKKFD